MDYQTKERPCLFSIVSGKRKRNGGFNCRFRLEVKWNFLTPWTFSNGIGCLLWKFSNRSWKVIYQRYYSGLSTKQIVELQDLYGPLQLYDSKIGRGFPKNYQSSFLKLLFQDGWNYSSSHEGWEFDTPEMYFKPIIKLHNSSVLVSPFLIPQHHYSIYTQSY